MWVCLFVVSSRKTIRYTSNKTEIFLGRSSIAQLHLLTLKGQSLWPFKVKRCNWAIEERPRNISVLFDFSVFASLTWPLTQRSSQGRKIAKTLKSIFDYNYAAKYPIYFKYGPKYFSCRGGYACGAPHFQFCRIFCMAVFVCCADACGISKIVTQYWLYWTVQNTCLKAVTKETLHWPSNNRLTPCRATSDTHCSKSL